MPLPPREKGDGSIIRGSVSNYDSQRAMAKAPCVAVEQHILLLLVGYHNPKWQGRYIS